MASRDHREDLKQWMIALATTHDGEVPVFLQPLAGNSSDKVGRLSTITGIQAQLREAKEEPGVYVADSGVYRASNMRQLNEAGVKWVSRVPETSKEAKAVLQEGSDEWRTAEDGSKNAGISRIDALRWSPSIPNASLRKSRARPVSLSAAVCLTSLSLSRSPAPLSPGGDRAEHSRPGAQTDGTPDNALGLSMR